MAPLGLFEQVVEEPGVYARQWKQGSGGQYDIEKIVKAKTGIPTLMIEADMADERRFAEGPIDTRIDVFLEILEKAGKQ